MMKKTLAILLSATLLTGCITTQPIQRQTELKDEMMYDLDLLGESWNDEKVKAAVITYMTPRLKDPASAQWVMRGEFEKGFAYDETGSLVIGYMTAFAVNAKNSYGGYTGFQTHYAFMRDGVILQLYEKRNGAFYPPVGTMKGAAPLEMTVEFIRGSKMAEEAKKKQ